MRPRRATGRPRSGASKQCQYIESLKRALRDGALLDLIGYRLGARMPSEPELRLWDCDSDVVLAAMSVETEAQVVPGRFD